MSDVNTATMDGMVTKSPGRLRIALGKTCEILSKLTLTAVGNLQRGAVASAKDGDDKTRRGIAIKFKNKDKLQNADLPFIQSDQTKRALMGLTEVTSQVDYLNRAIKKNERKTKRHELRKTLIEGILRTKAGTNYFYGKSFALVKDLKENRSILGKDLAGAKEDQAGLEATYNQLLARDHKIADAAQLGMNNLSAAIATKLNKAKEAYELAKKEYEDSQELIQPVEVLDRAIYSATGKLAEARGLKGEYLEEQNREAQAVATIQKEIAAGRRFQEDSGTQAFPEYLKNAMSEATDKKQADLAQTEKTYNEARARFEKSQKAEEKALAEHRASVQAKKDSEAARQNSAALEIKMKEAEQVYFKVEEQGAVAMDEFTKLIAASEKEILGRMDQLLNNQQTVEPAHQAQPYTQPGDQTRPDQEAGFTTEHNSPAQPVVPETQTHDPVYQANVDNYGPEIADQLHTSAWAGVSAQQPESNTNLTSDGGPMQMVNGVAVPVGIPSSQPEPVVQQPEVEIPKVSAIHIPASEVGTQSKINKTR